MKRLTYVFVSLLFLAILIPAAVQAAQPGKICSTTVGIMRWASECGVKSADTTTIDWPHMECEESSHNSTCNDNLIFVSQTTIRYTTKGSDPCGKAIWKSLQQITACGGHGMPGDISDWIVNTPQ